jgi:hypothetical protein
MNFRRTRNKRRCHGSAAHLANVADRIDRSYSPRGGREERELDVSSSNAAFKERCGRQPHPKRILTR